MITLTDSQITAAFEKLKGQEGAEFANHPTADALKYNAEFRKQLPINERFIALFGALGLEAGLSLAFLAGLLAGEDFFSQNQSTEGDNANYQYNATQQS